MDRYKKTVSHWNKIFKNEEPHVPHNRETGNEDFDRSLSWLTDGADSVLDFGCASGTLLFLCHQYGTTNHIGIDLSPQAITNAQEKAGLISGGQFHFLCGGTDLLQSIGSSSVDAAILSNIIDNLYPEDAHRVLSEIKRILKPQGRLLVKLNDVLTPEQVSEYGIRVIKGNLLDDGMILWNNTTEEWDHILSSYFCIDQFKNIYYREYDQYNRLYQLIRL